MSRRVEDLMEALETPIYSRDAGKGVIVGWAFKMDMVYSNGYNVPVMSITLIWLFRFMEIMCVCKIEFVVPK